MNKRPRAILADSSLILVGMIWGLNFTLIKFAIGIIPPMEFIGLRFFIAALILMIIFQKHLRATQRAELLAGSIIGIFLFLGFLTQTIGLQYTTPGKSGFITSLYIVIVPFMASLLKQKFVGRVPITGAILALSGLCMISISLNELFFLSKGDLLSVVCAVFYAFHILAVEHYSLTYNPYVLTIVQIAFTGIMSMVYSLTFEPVQLEIPNFVWGAVLYTGLLGTSFALVIQNVAQKYTSSSHAALLMGLEAPFSLLFSIWIWGEAPSPRGLIGSTLIFIAILFVELGPSILSRYLTKSQQSDAQN